MNSYWIDSTKDLKKDFDSLTNDINVDVCIIGGGITGISTAYYLAKSGLKVCVLEKDKIGHHATGNTTAKITMAHGLFYDYLINTFSSELAQNYLNANLEAISNIKNIVDTETIDCDFEYQDNYIFTNDSDEIIKLKHEVLALDSLGFNAELVDTIDAPVDMLWAIKYPNQAQFNPLKYLYGLVNSILKYDGKIYENSKVYDVKKTDDGYSTFTKDCKVNSKFVVLASHYPIINVPGFYFLKMYQEASYIIGIETDSELFDGMYINTKSPVLSLRTAVYNDKRILLIGGANHKVGTDDDISNSYKVLEEVAKALYPDAKVLFRWQTQDCISLDKIPYIGEFSNVLPNAYVATGFKKWGMSTSNVAANIISNKILGFDNKFESAFTSTRFNPIKNGTEFVNMLKQVSDSLVIDKFKIPSETLDSIKNDSGKIVEFDDMKIGIYKDTKRKSLCY